MSRIFVSHSSQNNAEAVAIRDWLSAEGWNDVFLDLDPERGIRAGERWERALNEAASRCEAVLFLVSRQWLASRWCLKEFNLAHKLNKRLFGVLIEAIPLAELPQDLAGTWQVVDLAAGQDHVMMRVKLPRTHEEAHVTFSKEGLDRLRNGLSLAGLDARFFAWNPDRPPYRGLKPLEAEDAGIFFGRDAPIVEATDSLRGVRDGAAPRVLVILGASGAGKSSFLRAGLLPRLARDDRNFLTLPVIRPERAAITGESGLLNSIETQLVREGIARPRSEIRSAITAGAIAMRPLLRALVDKAFAAMLAEETGAKRPAVVLAVDQAEELFFGEGTTEGEMLLVLISELVRQDDPNIIALFTIRSDSYDRLETAKPLAGVRQRTFALLPMPRGAYQTVIEAPAARLRETNRKLTIEPRLTQQLLEDIEKGGGSDALPLLAFTLEQLYLEYGGGGTLKVADYEAFGGIKGAIEAAVERAFSAADSDPAIPRDRNARLALLRRGLIPWLAGIDPETASPRRRVARLADIPEEAKPLINTLVEQRLLATDRVTVREAEKERIEITIEPAHESLLRQWGLLRGWLEEDFAALTTLEGVKRAARDWAANGRRTDWLNHAGTRLDEAVKVAVRKDLAADFSSEARDYLRACEKAEQQSRVARYAAIGIALLAAAAAFWGIWQDRQSLRREAALMTTVAQRAIGEEDNYVLAMRAALHGLPPPLRTSLSSWWSVQNIRAMWAPSWSEKELRTIEAKLGGAAQGDLLELKLRGHSSDVRTAAFSPDGTRIVTASDDGTARVWNARTGQELLQLRIPAAQFRSAAFSPDGMMIATASTDKAARLWDATTGAQLLLFGRHEDEVWSAAFSPHGKRIVTASKDKTARIWDAGTGAELLVLAGHDDWVLSALFSPDGSQILTTSSDRTARLWDAHTGAVIREFQGHTSAVRSAAFSPDATLIITASFDYSARIWDARTGKELILLKKGNNAMRGAAFSPDGTRVVTTSDDGTATVWNTKQGTRLITLIGHSQAAVSAMFSPDGDHIVSASEDRTGRVWKANGTPEFLRLKDHQGPVLAARISPDGKRTVTASSDRTARLWDADSGISLLRLEGHTDWIRSAGFNSDGSRVVTASKDQTVKLWDAQTGALLRTIPHPAEVFAAAFDPSGKRIVTASADGIARVWDSETGTQILELKGHKKPIWSVSFSPDGRRIITASDDFTWRIWDAATGSEVLQKAHDQEVKSASFSLDGTRVVTASWDHTTRVWDSISGVELMRFLDNNGLAFDANFSPDGDRVVTAFGDGTAWVWDAHTGAKLIQLKGHERPVRSVSFSPDGRFIVTASEDRTARLWHSEWLVNIRGEQLARRVCSEKLVDEAQVFTRQDESEDENLSGLKGQNACALHQ